MGYIIYYNPSITPTSAGRKKIRIDFESMSNALGKTAVIPSGFSSANNASYIIECSIPEALTIAYGAFSIIGAQTFNASMKFDFPNVVKVGVQAFGSAGYGSASVYLPKCNQLSTRSFYSARVDSLILNEFLEEIPLECFYTCSSLKSLNNTPFLKRILDNGFYNCVNMIWELPSQLEYLGNGGLQNCRYVTGTLPNTVTYVGEYGLSGCVLINIPKLPDNLSTLEKGAFANTNCTINILPDRFSRLPSAVFRNTKVSFSNLPKITYYEDGCLAQCSNITSLTLGSPGNPVTYITPYNTSGIVTLGSFNNNSQLTRITVYTNGGTAIAGAPWGANNATVTFIAA